MVYTFDNFGGYSPAPAPDGFALKKEREIEKRVVAAVAPHNAELAREWTAKAGAGELTPENLADMLRAAGCLPGGVETVRAMTTDDKEREKLLLEMLPGPKKKQAESIYQNVKWLAEKYGEEKIGFLTITMGDVDKTTGEFVGITDRKEAGRRWNILMTGKIKKRYLCGVAVAERHKSGAIHYHLLVVCRSDIRTGINFKECFPGKDEKGKYKKADFRTRPQALKDEWTFWNNLQAQSLAGGGYSVGRCQMQPIMSNGEACGRYLGKYISKNLCNRTEQDKGWRMLRYFGDWRQPIKEFIATGPGGAVRKFSSLMDCDLFCLGHAGYYASELNTIPPRYYYAEYYDFSKPGGNWEYRKRFTDKKAANQFCKENYGFILNAKTAQKARFSARHGGLGAGAKSWREKCKQVQVISRNEITPDNVKELCGVHWAYNWGKLFKHTIFFDLPELPPSVNEKILEHNFNVEKDCGNRARLITDASRGADKWKRNKAIIDNDCTWEQHLDRKRGREFETYDSLFNCFRDE